MLHEKTEKVPSALDAKIVARDVLPVDLLALDPLDAGRGGSPLQPGFELVNGRVAPRDTHLDGAVGEIADGSGQAEARGRAMRPPAEAHPLDPSVDPEARLGWRLVGHDVTSMLERRSGGERNGELRSGGPVDRRS